MNGPNPLLTENELDGGHLRERIASLPRLPGTDDLDAPKLIDAAFQYDHNDPENLARARAADNIAKTLADVLIPAVTPDPPQETRESFRVTTGGGFVTLHFKTEQATLTKREARKLAAAINKAAL